MSNSVWSVAGRLLARHLESGARLDLLLEEGANQLAPVERRRCRHLLYGAVRHLGLLQYALDRHLRTPPRALLRAALLLGAFELLEHPEETPSIVHHAVEQTRQLASASEARVVNAVLRKVAATLGELQAAGDVAASDAAGLALRFSHPTWLVERWITNFGEAATRELLAWNQKPAPVHARLVGLPRGSRGNEAGTAVGEGSSETETEPPRLPDFFKPTRWPGFSLLEQPDWAEVEQLIASGSIYLQDPATVVAPALLGVEPGENVLDLCASPGGKTLQLAEALTDEDSKGRVVAVDLPGPRLQRLRENLARYPALAARVSVVGKDVHALTEDALALLKLPTMFDAVLIDVPCSNTGVLRHRVEVKWRLEPREFIDLPRLQLALLRRAAALVRPGGRLVYSTCSLEPEENEGVIEAFLGPPVEKGGPGSAKLFALERAEHNRPWETGCDGAAAFLLRRRD